MPRTPAREAAHTQTVPGFGTVRVLRLDPHADAPVVHAWVREERAAFWGMNGLTEEQVAEIYAHLDTLDTHHAYLLEKDGDPAGLLQTYEPHGRPGQRVLRGPPRRHRRPPAARAAWAEGVPTSGWSSALLSAVASYVLLGLDRRRVVVDPDVRNEKAIARFLKQGFVAGEAVVLPEIDLPDVHLPEKHAQLAFLTREVAFPGDA